MFDSIGWAEILVLGFAGLFILGPERLPSAAAWLGRNIRKMREFASGARDQLREEMGPEFEELRKPLQDLQQLRSFDPKRAVARHLFDDDNGYTNGGTKPNGYTPPRQTDPPALSAGEKPPIDPDAT
ncbi:Sec-independent protein translocase protein TatB [Actinophytocola sp.]|uniref:Sec-independent protein translocase protein TatB n=1 Tax=Actinophytocola sp. TaxID=1872138 RepID=UPI002D7EA906|nr:Sec-independent protein translocase protein TatB [Actinophytocola sp.]HET9143535.1 Sec-independent protein translocase protein TatB [Actinophytocola sp.]HEU5109860.1 Sec-independent protein translocase protein TatB [Micromonosporaceae bacterium]